MPFFLEIQYKMFLSNKNSVSTHGNYVKAILLPWLQFKKMKETETLATGPSVPVETGDESLLPPDLRLKLYQQERYNSKYKEQLLPGLATKKPDKVYPTEADIPDIVSSVTEKWRPYARAVLQTILQNPQIISWRRNFEIELDREPIRDSNIVELIQFLLKQKTITRQGDVPKAAKPFYDTLLSIGVPKSWIRVTFPKTGKTPRGRRERSHWDAYGARPPAPDFSADNSEEDTTVTPD